MDKQEAAPPNDAISNTILSAVAPRRHKKINFAQRLPNAMLVFEASGGMDVSPVFEQAAGMSFSVVWFFPIIERHFYQSAPSRCLFHSSGAPMDATTRIAQFENMTQADPDNDMAHFSLGGAYAQAGRNDDAARAYLRCIEINPALSKAHQLAAAALIKTGDLDRAADVLTKGYTVAAELGDLAPKNAMGEMLTEMGRPVPEVVNAKPEETVVGSFICQRTGRPGTQLDRPPFKGPIGQWIFENISQQTWREWIGQGTKVINELRLDLSNEEDADAYDRHMCDFLGIDETLQANLTSISQ